MLKDKALTDFASLNLAAPVMKALDKAGYSQPTPIQEQAIPALLEGHDVLGVAQTGTGKTAAFSLPIMDNMCRNIQAMSPMQVRHLVLSPTRELAAQIADSMREYARFMAPHILCVFGGSPIHKQIKALRMGVDVLVATPGRLLDLVDQNAVDLSSVEVLVLDEADQMMDMGFIHPLRRIVRIVPRDRQTVFFSATMPPAIKELADTFLTNPVEVSITQESSTAERVNQSVIFCNKTEKQALLLITLQDETMDRVLVFTRTKYGADRVVKFLSKLGVRSEAIHGDKRQSQRTKALNAFKQGDVRVLVATDIAARGIDISGVSHVINFEIPNVPEQYVHRIGRTARAGREGDAISFVSQDEKKFLRDIERMIRMKIPKHDLPEDLAATADSLQEEMEAAYQEAKKVTEADQTKRRAERNAGGRHRKRDDGGRGRPERGARPSGDKRKPAPRRRDDEARKDRPARPQRRRDEDWSPENAETAERRPERAHKPRRDRAERGEGNRGERRPRREESAEGGRPQRSENRGPRQDRRDEGDRPRRPRQDRFEQRRDEGDRPRRPRPDRDQSERSEGRERPARQDRSDRPRKPRFEQDGERRSQGEGRPQGERRQDGDRDGWKKGPRRDGKPSGKRPAGTAFKGRKKPMGAEDSIRRPRKPYDPENEGREERRSSKPRSGPSGKPRPANRSRRPSRPREDA